MKNYIRYMKNNPKVYWFRRKLYGWGWFPITWQGWLATLLFIIICLLNGFYLEYKVGSGNNPSATDLNIFFGIILISIIVLLIICFKTGEKPRWSWGK